MAEFFNFERDGKRSTLLKRDLLLPVFGLLRDLEIVGKRQADRMVSGFRIRKDIFEIERTEFGDRDVTGENLFVLWVGNDDSRRSLGGNRDIISQLIADDASNKDLLTQAIKRTVSEHKCPSRLR